MVAWTGTVPVRDLRAQYRRLAADLDSAARRVLRSGVYVLGPEVTAFEADFASFCGSRYCVGVDSGTSAVHLALLALGIGPGDEVITVSHTFVATVEAIRHTGARPVLVDVLPETATLDPSKVEAAITPSTRGIVPVHLYGACADMDSIVALARTHGLPVVEDAAQAHGARHRGRRAGSMGDLGCFSFYPGKNLGACGEAGAVVTDDGALAARLRALRDHGQMRKHRHEVVGYNHRLDALQAAFLRVKLRHLDGWNERHRSIAATYRDRLAGSVGMLEYPPEIDAVHHVLPIFVRARTRLRESLGSLGVVTSVHYPVPVHLQPAHADLGYVRGDLPVTESLCRRTLSLPIYPELSDRAVHRIARAVRTFSAPEAPLRS